MTERLYYTDPYLTEFDAQVLRIEDRDGKRVAVLDRTAFYPTSGGQPFDVGMLSGVPVIDVIDDDSGAILHVVERDPGERVRGTIDWARRFDHMQQHTGQHVLSAAFDLLLGARTESFHLGTLSSTIDLNREITTPDLRRVEDEANRIVWEDHPVSIKFADAEEAAKMPLRKESARTGRLRLIDVDGYDISACGGTHVARTGAIGTIVVASTEKFRGGTRVEFLCGARTLRGHRALRDAVASSVRLLSVLPEELPAAIERQQADAKDAKRRIKDLQSQLATHEAARLAAAGSDRGDLRLVVEALDGWDQNGLKLIASAIAERPKHVAVLFSMPTPSALVIARAADAPFDSAAALKTLTGRFGGKGGGRADLAQGGGLQGTVAEFLDVARTL
jgi:alanyl-tRNA synthetase